MEKKTYSIAIDAPREKVWETLWGDSSYREWTSVFAEGSHVKTDWKKGSKTLFLDGKNQGMVSEIAENKPNEFMSFRHIGMVENGVEDTQSEAVKKWAGAMENYTLKAAEGKTQLLVEMDLDEAHKEYFEKTWPKALDSLKKLAEQN
jgi:uncharacterized protein YndB with AHSA1/START domain